MSGRVPNWLKAMLAIFVAEKAVLADTHERVVTKPVPVPKEEDAIQRKVTYFSRKHFRRVGKLVARRGKQVVIKMTARNGEPYFVKRASDKVYL